MVVIQEWIIKSYSIKEELLYMEDERLNEIKAMLWDYKLKNKDNPKLEDLILDTYEIVNQYSQIKKLLN